MFVNCCCNVEIIFWSRGGSSLPLALKRLSGDCCDRDDSR